MAKQSFRRCIVCREREQKERLIRFVCEDGVLRRDVKQNLPGRGGYVHDDAVCIEKANNAQLWCRVLREKAVDLSSVFRKRMTVTYGKIKSL